jgi:hypothetical protein
MIDVADATPPSGGQPLARLAVSESTGTEPVFLATVTISKASDQKLECGCNAVSEVALGRVLPLVQRFQAECHSPLTSADSFDWSPLVDHLRDDGLTVEEIPLSDREIEFHLDLQSGMMVGSQRATHAYAPADDGIP